TLIDVRNDFEVKQGTMRGALNPKTKSFGEFPEFANVLQTLHKIKKSQKIITFCTGGIRCEKAALLLQRQGFTNVFQLEGGILEYLSKTSGDFFDGRCF